MKIGNIKVANSTQVFAQAKAPASRQAGATITFYAG
jgi:hypothetical protein